MFAVCSGIFDKTTGTYHPNTITEQQQCCLDLCKPTHEYCVNQCKIKVGTLFSKELNNGEMTLEHALDRCEHLCVESHSLCKNTCKLLSPKFQYSNEYHKCATEKCPEEQNLQPTSDCVEKNKTSIMKCCMTKTNDKEYCSFQQNRILNQNMGVTTSSDTVLPVYDSKTTDSTGFMVIIAIICAILIIPLLMKLK